MFSQEKHHRRIPVSESYSLTGLYPNTLYYMWLAAKSQRGEGAPTPPIQVRTKQYGKFSDVDEKSSKPTTGNYGVQVGDASVQYEVHCRVIIIKIIIK